LRLWTAHPKYLDVKGLVALWRESLLAQKILMRKTRGWRNHPQLDRFRSHPNPLSAIGFYLHYVYEEGERRGYKFQKKKIYQDSIGVPVIKVSREFVLLELEQLKQKLKSRDYAKYKELLKVKEIELHPLFQYIQSTSNN
jgi:hypothetical protein